MPQRSTVSLLPEAVRNELNQKLIAKGFSDYRELCEWLESKGWTISKSSLQRYGKKFELQLTQLKEVTEQALALVDVCGDDENALGDALTRLTQMKAYQALIEMDEPGEMTLATLGRMVADLNRSSVTVKRYSSEVRKEINKRFDQLEREAEDSPELVHLETLRRVREEIYGII